MNRRSFVKLAAVAPCLATRPALGPQPPADDPLQSRLRLGAAQLGLPGFVAGVVRDGELSLVQAEGFADLEGRTAMRRDHIFYVASLTKTFTAVALMQYVQERKISLDDYVLDYPFLSVGFTADRLVDPNVKLKHVLSHTSEGTPGDQFVYNGGRFNFIYGAFEHLTGNPTHYEACAQAIRERVGGPLGLTSTLAGYPVDKADPRISRIATPYFLDSRHKAATRDAGASGGTIVYPGTGLLSTVDDLAKFMVALDRNVLLSPESYARLTTPFPLNDGRASPYGLGWSTQRVGGHAVHWHYGYGDSYSALLVRLPGQKASFIFLSNTGAASAPFLLGYGNLLTSPFAVAFLDSVLPGVLSDADRDVAQLFLARYAETAFGRHPGEANRLLRRLRSTAPGRFRRSDRALAALLSGVADPAFAGEMDSLAAAYRASGDFHPDISLAIANYYDGAGRDVAKRDAFLRHAADRLGYEQGATREACVRLGTDLLRHGRTEEGRKYLWRAARSAQTSGASVESQERIVRHLRR